MIFLQVRVNLFQPLLGVSKLIVSTVHRDADEDDSVSVQSGACTGLRWGRGEMALRGHNRGPGGGGGFLFPLG